MGVVVKARVAVELVRGIWATVGLCICAAWRTQRCIERIARVEVCGRITVVSIIRSSAAMMELTS